MLMLLVSGKKRKLRMTLSSYYYRSVSVSNEQLL